MAVEKMTFIEDEHIFWPDWWDSEAVRHERYPRQAVHWCASRRTRRDRVQAFCSELDALIARRIRFERVAAGLRQVDLANAIGVTQATISRIEGGKSSASLADVVRIAIQLKRPIEAFVRPPSKGRETGWERHPTAPLIPRSVWADAIDGKLPINHPIYD